MANGRERGSDRQMAESQLVDRIGMSLDEVDRQIEELRADRC
jgi:hypothetical protein